MRFPADGAFLQHAGKPYDPVKAHEYYERTKKLKGRKKGSAQPATSGLGSPAAAPKPKVNARKKAELQARIQGLEARLRDLEKIIADKKKAAQEAEADKKKAAKEAAKPDTAAEKADKARDAKKYRDKHKSEIASKAKKADSKSGGSSKSEGSAAQNSDKSVAQLEKAATTIRGAIAVAKQKLRAL